MGRLFGFVNKKASGQGMNQSVKLLAVRRFWLRPMVGCCWRVLHMVRMPHSHAYKGKCRPIYWFRQGGFRVRASVGEWSYVIPLMWREYPLQNTCTYVAQVKPYTHPLPLVLGIELRFLDHKSLPFTINHSWPPNDAYSIGNYIHWSSLPHKFSQFVLKITIIPNHNSTLFFWFITYIIILDSGSVNKV